MKSRLAVLAATCALLCPAPAMAQRTEENATTESSDAFGTQIGSERTGLYSSREVRGFDPVDAGNARIEALYFDQLDRLPNSLTDRSTIRVGITAQRYVFPAPTGLVDTQLVKPGKDPVFSLDIDSGSYFAPGLAIDFEVPLDGENLGLAGGMMGRNFISGDGRENRFRNFGLLTRWSPYGGAELEAFAGATLRSDDEARPTFYVDGTDLPPEVERGVDLSQPWSDRDNAAALYGAMARLPVGGFRIEAGVFLNRVTNQTRFADLLFGVAADGSVRERVIVADGGLVDQSLSGEVRLVHEWRSQALAHTLTASARGRHKQRLFGSSRRISIGASTVNAPDIRDEPDYTLRASSRDDVKQITYGLAYGLVWRGGASIDLGVSRSNYRKDVDFADPLVADAATRTDPILWNASASYALAPWLTVYGGIARGMEEALVAPEIAVNRSEAPPAIRSRQEEAGVRITYGALTFVGGVFQIAKPYYNLDPARLYRQLGTVTIKGLELSLAGEILPGLSLVGGTVFMDPVISGEVVDSGLIGQRPVGQVSRRSVVNLDWRPAGGTSPFSVDLAVESFSSRNANAQGTLSAPATTNFNLGARYRFSMGETSFLLRLRIENLLNEYAWQVSSSGGFTYTDRRDFTAQLVVDF